MIAPMSDSGILQDQIDYYRARAGEYDEWWFRTGRYDRGPEFNERWRAEVVTVEDALDTWLTAQRPHTLLELACGTGLFTRRLAPRVPHITAVDASPEVLAINRSRVAYLIDSAFDPTSTAKDHVLPGRDAGIVTRRLNDGREFRIVKLFWEPHALAARLGELRWSATLAQTPSYFIYGSAQA